VLTRCYILFCTLTVFSLPATGGASRAGDVSRYLLERQFGLSELRHTAFRAKDGAPNSVRALAQTPDGFLWVGTETGLYRFDGVRFDSTLGERLPNASIWALYADLNGDLWIGYLFGGVSRLHQGELTHFPPGNIPAGAVHQFLRTSDGALWVATVGGLARFDGKRWQKIDSSFGYSEERALSLAVSASRLEVLTPTTAFARDNTSGQFLQIARSQAVARHFATPVNSAWSPAGGTGDLEYEPSQSMVDSSGAWWHSAPGALARVRWSPGPNSQATEELFTVGDGLSGEVESVLQDREGNIWAGTMGGLDRFSVALLHRLKLPDPIYLPFLVGEQEGELLVGSFTGPSMRVGHSIRQDATAGVGVTAATTTRDGAWWTAGMDGIVRHFHGEAFKIAPPPAAAASLDAMTTSLYQAIAVEPDGAIWVSIATRGLYRRDHGEWQAQGPRTGMPEGPATRLLADEGGRLWITYPNDRVVVREGTRVVSYGEANGLHVGNVLGVTVHGRHVWVAGDQGFAALVGEHLVAVKGQGGERFAFGGAVIETDDGELWINGARGIYRLSKDSVNIALSAKPHEVPFELFDWRDGLGSAAVVIRPFPTALNGADGRLWFSRQNGIWWIDPRQKLQQDAPTLVSIEAVTGDDGTYVPRAQRIDAELPRNLRIDYTAPVLRDPERINFRYRLTGVDGAWQEAGMRRQTYYTNLSPGEHRFELRAENGAGHWSDVAVLTFRVAAAFYQTAWFRSMVALLASLLLVLVVIVRTEQIKARIRQHIAARTYERERIARELHDTLLQGVQSLVLRTNIWANDRALPGELRTEIREVSEQARAIVVEARDRIVVLRNGDGKDSDLIATLQRMANARPANESPAVEIVTRGMPHPITNDAYQQLVDIAREAVRNAIQHANCRRVRVTVEYHPNSIVLAVADDGCGITPSLLQADRSAGHYGILGMQERAQQLGATFALGPNGTSGAKVSVHVPAAIAFADVARAGWFDLIARWWRRSRRTRSRDPESRASSPARQRAIDRGR
jgi:signal transduction histidine kinase/ligand-binding sensor domain-containing protein